MKVGKILPGTMAIGVLVFLASCAPARYYNDYAPAPPPVYGPSFSLIVDPFPGIAINRYSDGRYYYRNPQGYTYWRGRDNRYYLDRSYVGRDFRRHRDYDAWRSNGNHGRERRHRH